MDFLLQENSQEFERTHNLLAQEMANVSPFHSPPGKTVSRRLLNGNAPDDPLSQGELKWTVSHYGFCPQQCPWTWVKGCE